MGAGELPIVLVPVGSDEDALDATLAALDAMPDGKLDARTVFAELDAKDDALRETAWWVAGRLSRFVPVLSAGSHAVESRSQVGDTGRKMAEVLRRLSEVAPPELGAVEDAVEIPAGPTSR